MTLRTHLAAVALAGLVLTLAIPGTASAIAPAKKAKKQSLVGTISWSITTTYDREGDPMSGTTAHETTSEKASLKVNVKRDPTFTRTYVLKRTNLPYSYSMTGHEVSADHSFGQVTCTTTTDQSASGQGKTAVSPHVFGKYKPNRDVLTIDKRTKGISLSAVTPGSGSATTNQVGSGVNPCGDGTWTDPVNTTSGTTLIDSRWICKPKGLKKIPSAEQPLFGKWNNKKKHFDFNCKATFTNGEYETQEISVTGFLKYKR